MTVQVIAKYGGVALYALASASYVAHFVMRSRRLGSLSCFLLFLAVLGHGLSIFLDGLREGQLPIGGVRDAFGLSAWILAAVYLLLELTGGNRTFGALVAPVALVFSLVPCLLGSSSGASNLPPRGLWSEIHIVTGIAAVVCFTYACVVGINYLLVHREIGSKRLGWFCRRLPSLEELDSLNRRAVQMGYLFLTATIACGTVWAAQVWGSIWLWDPKQTMTMLIWIFYGLLLHAWLFRGWRGVRAACLSIVGFGLTLVCFAVVGVAFSSVHAFP